MLVFCRVTTPVATTINSKRLKRLQPNKPSSSYLQGKDVQIIKTIFNEDTSNIASSSSTVLDSSVVPLPDHVTVLSDSEGGESSGFDVERTLKQLASHEDRLQMF